MTEEVLPIDPIAFSPVSEDEPGPAQAATGEIGLSLSGGGYRAMLFHVGALWRLNELGYLPRLERVSSVSGGSITAALLALKWSQLDFDGSGVAQRFAPEVVEPIRRLAGKTIDQGAILAGALGPGSIGDQVISAYRKHLYGDATLQDLPDAPLFILTASNVQSGALWRFTKRSMGDYRVGSIQKPALELATAVAASSAFPPFLSPVELQVEPDQFAPRSGKDLQQEPYTSSVVLTDGGVYDNLGLEPVWKNCDTVLASDGGGKMEPEPEPKLDWARHTYRVLSLIDNQVRSLRKRQLIESLRLRKKMLKQGVSPADQFLRRVTREGAYWGIRSKVAGYFLDDALDCPESRTLELADLPTRLKRLDVDLQERLINWGYAICDTAMRKHVNKQLPPPAGFPYTRGV